jgi:hypothetical protein
LLDILKDNIYFVDVEASAFKGYPIQVGWAILEPSGNIVTDSIFIYHSAWDKNELLWDPAAQNVHKFTKEHIRQHGKPPNEVAEHLNRLFMDQVVLSDAPEWDSRWIQQIYTVANKIPMFTMDHINYLNPYVDPMALNKLIMLHVNMITHNAEDDARYLATVFKGSLLRQ